MGPWSRLPSLGLAPKPIDVSRGRGHMTTTDGRLAGKVGLVTGGASGIGRATVRRFVAEEARVVAGDRDEAGLAALADELGDAVATVAGDVTVEADVEALA